jgi:hypothetical protein
MARNGWENLDVADLLRRREEALGEATVAANAGPFEVPLGGGPLRRKFPTGAQDDYRENIPAEYAAIYYDIYRSPPPEKK